MAYLGYVDQARSRLKEALSEARRLKHAYTLANVLGVVSLMELLICSPDLQRHTEELVALSTEHGFSLWLSLATASRGRSSVLLGESRDGFALLKQGLAAVHATGAAVRTPLLLMYLAEAHGKLGQPGEGLNCLAEAARVIEITEERVNEAELHRVHGDLLNVTGDQSAAELHYCQAIAVAERQSAKLFQLRASTSLARVLARPGQARGSL